MLIKRSDVRSRRRAGFSLMELLVVVAILVVLAGVGGVIYLNIQESNYKEAARVQIRNLEQAASIYKSKNGDFPEALQELTQQQPNGDDPLIEPRALIDPWNREYQYAKQGQNAAYNKPDIWSEGPRPGDPNSRIGNW